MPKKALPKFAIGFSALAGCYVLLSLVAGITLAELSLHLPRHRVSQEYRLFAYQRAKAIDAALVDIQITAKDGTTLRAWFATPHLGNGSTVLLLHGVTDNRIGVSGYAEFFLRHGYSVLLPDMRGHGESGGVLATYGLREADDVRRWIAWIRQNQSPQCVFGFGESMGAGILLQSLDRQANFCAVVAESPFADFREGVTDRVVNKLHSQSELARLASQLPISFGLIYARIRYRLNFSDVSPRNVVSHSGVPVLLIHGMADTNLLPRNSEMIHRDNLAETELWEVPGAEHCGAWSTAPVEFEKRVLDWFRTHNRQPRLPWA